MAELRQRVGSGGGEYGIVSFLDFEPETFAFLLK